jgi:hypothetical protein
MAIDFSSIQTPLILGSASLIAFLSVRGANIAERIRSADKEIVDAATVPERRKNLLFQVHGLRDRYLADTYATVALLLSFASFVAMAALAPFEHEWATAAFGIGIVAGVIGFCLTLYEVVTSKTTLFADIAYAQAVADAKAPPSGPGIALQ